MNFLTRYSWLKLARNLNTWYQGHCKKNKRYTLLEIIVIVWNCPMSLGWFLISVSAYCSPGMLHLTSPFVLGTLYVCSSSGKESIGGCRRCLLQGRASCEASSVQCLLFYFKSIAREWVSVGLVHVQLCLYLLWRYSLEGEAKFKPNTVPHALTFPHRNAKPASSGDLYQQTLHALHALDRDM